MLDDPLQIMISMVVASGVAMYPIGFLLSACSGCCGCPAEPTFNRCLRWVRQDLPESYGTEFTDLPVRRVSQQVATYHDAGLREVATAREINGSITLDREALRICDAYERTEEFQVVVPSSSVAPGFDGYVEGAEDYVVRTITLRIIGQSTPLDDPDFSSAASSRGDGVLVAQPGEDLVAESPVKDRSEGTPCLGGVNYRDSYVLSGHARIDGSLFTRGYMQSLMDVDTYIEGDLFMLRLTFTPPPIEQLRYAPKSYVPSLAYDRLSEPVVLRYIFRAHAQPVGNGEDEYTRTHFHVDIALLGSGWRFLDTPVFYGADAHGDSNTTITEYGEPLTVRGGMRGSYVEMAPGAQIEVYDAYVITGSQYLDGTAVTRSSLMALVSPRFDSYPSSPNIFLDWSGGGGLFDYVPQVSGIVQIRYVFRMTHGDGRWVYWTRDFHPGGGGQAAPSGMSPPSFSPLVVPDVPPLFDAPHYECCEFDAIDHIEPPIEPYWDAEKSEIVVGTGWMVRQNKDGGSWEIDLPKLIYRPTGAALLIPGRIEPQAGVYYYRSNYSERTIETGFVIYGLTRRTVYPNDFDRFDLVYHLADPVLSPSLVASWMSGGYPISVQIKDPYGFYPTQTWTVEVTPPTQMCGVDICRTSLGEAYLLGDNSGLADSQPPGWFSLGGHPIETVKFDGEPIPIGTVFSPDAPDECSAEAPSLTLGLFDCEYRSRYVTCAGGATTCWANYYGEIVGSAACEAALATGGNYGHDGSGGSGRREWSPAVGIGQFYDSDLLGALESGPARTVVVNPRGEGYSAAGYGTYTLGEEGTTPQQTHGCSSQWYDTDEMLTIDGIAFYNATGGCSWGGEVELTVPGKKLAVYEWNDSLYQVDCHDDRISLVEGTYVSVSRTIDCFTAAHTFQIGRTDGGTIGAWLSSVRSKWCQSEPYLQTLYLSGEYRILRSDCDYDGEYGPYIERACIRHPGDPPPPLDCTATGFSVSQSGGGVLPTGIAISSQSADQIDETTETLVVQWENPGLRYENNAGASGEKVSPAKVRYDATIRIKPSLAVNDTATSYLASIAERADVTKSGAGGCDIDGLAAYGGKQGRSSELSYWSNVVPYWRHQDIESRVVLIESNECISFVFKNNNDGGLKCTVSVSKVSGENVVKIIAGPEQTSFTLEGLPHPDPGTTRQCILRLTFGGRIEPLDFIVRQDQ